MKNANIFVDVDLTLIDSNGKILPGARDALAVLKSKAATFFFGQLMARNTQKRWLQ